MLHGERFLCHASKLALRSCHIETSGVGKGLGSCCLSIFMELNILTFYWVCAARVRTDVYLLTSRCKLSASHSGCEPKTQCLHYKHGNPGLTVQLHSNSFKLLWIWFITEELWLQSKLNFNTPNYKLHKCNTQWSCHVISTSARNCFMSL